MISSVRIGDILRCYPSAGCYRKSKCKALFLVIKIGVLCSDYIITCVSIVPTPKNGCIKGLKETGLAQIRSDSSLGLNMTRVK
jgi:hypothetical protein